MKLKLLAVLFFAFYALLAQANENIDMNTPLDEFADIDPLHEVPDVPLKRALIYFKTHPKTFKNKNFIGIVDFTQDTYARRFYIIDMKTGAVTSFIVSHGQGSDLNHDGVADDFSNVDGSHASSLGFIKTAETYEGQWGYSLRLDGLSETNSKIRERNVVLHGWQFVSEDWGWAANSWGCLAVDYLISDIIINRMKEGALIYVWAGQE